MAPCPPPAPGNPAGGPPAPPLDPHALTSLLARDPARAAALLAAMRPALRHAQAEAPRRARWRQPRAGMAAWADLIARCGPPLAPRAPRAPPAGADAPCASIYDPETLTDLLAEQPARAAALLGRLSAPQRRTQAVAVAA